MKELVKSISSFMQVVGLSRKRLIRHGRFVSII